MIIFIHSREIDREIDKEAHKDHQERRMSNAG